jgi:RNA polymerase sigma factor (sigma-70 family)
MPERKQHRNSLTPEEVRSIANENLKLVYKISWKFRVVPQDSFTRDDLISEGTIGLIRGIQLCDLDSDKSFSTFLGAHIEGNIRRFLRDRRELLRPSRGCQPHKVFSFDHSPVIDGDPLIDSIASPWTPYADDLELLQQIQVITKFLPPLTNEIIKAKASGLNDQAAAKLVGCNRKTLIRHLENVKRLIGKYG